MAYKVVKLNPSEKQLWDNGYYFKCAYKLKMSYERHDLVEIRNDDGDKLGYAKVIAVEKHQSSFEPLFLGTSYQLAFEANTPPAPMITLLIFELLDKWEGQE
jgi:hypothetical protein